MRGPSAVADGHSGFLKEHCNHNCARNDLVRIKKRLGSLHMNPNARIMSWVGDEMIAGIKTGVRCHSVASAWKRHLDLAEQAPTAGVLGELLPNNPPHWFQRGLRDCLRGDAELTDLLNGPACVSLVPLSTHIKIEDRGRISAPTATDFGLVSGSTAMSPEMEATMATHHTAVRMRQDVLDTPHTKGEIGFIDERAMDTIVPDSIKLLLHIFFTGELPAIMPNEPVVGSPRPAKKRTSMHSGWARTLGNMLAFCGSKGKVVTPMHVGNANDIHKTGGKAGVEMGCEQGFCMGCNHLLKMKTTIAKKALSDSRDDCTPSNIKPAADCGGGQMLFSCDNIDFAGTDLHATQLVVVQRQDATTKGDPTSLTIGEDRTFQCPPTWNQLRHMPVPPDKDVGPSHDEHDVIHMRNRTPLPAKQHRGCQTPDPFFFARTNDCSGGDQTMRSETCGSAQGH